jgi:hypothetical protein
VYFEGTHQEAVKSWQREFSQSETSFPLNYLGGYEASVIVVFSLRTGVLPANPCQSNSALECERAVGSRYQRISYSSKSLSKGMEVHTPQESRRKFLLPGVVTECLDAALRSLRLRDRVQAHLLASSAEKTRENLSFPSSLGLLPGVLLLAQLILCVACGSSGGSDQSQMPADPSSGQLASDRNSLSFGTVTVGSSSSQSVTLTASLASVTISQASVTGNDFSVVAPTLPITLMAGRSTSLVVEFSPSAAGTVTGSVNLVSNASNSSPPIAVSGTGDNPAPPPAHTITLSWDASTLGDVIGYNVYRGTQPGGPYDLIIPSPIPETSYTDSSVSIGTTYYYVVTAVDGHGKESSYSNQASATIANPDKEGRGQSQRRTDLLIRGGLVLTTAAVVIGGYWAWNRFVVERR